MRWFFKAFILIQSLIFSRIKAFDTLDDIGTAKQSSSYGIYNASKALDGNRNQTWDGGSCGHTATRRRTAWWRLDIGQQVNIYNIVIYYRNDRPDRLDGFYIYISDTFDEQQPNSGHLCYHDQETGYPNTLQNKTCNYPGRYVVIYNERYGSRMAILELCEVEVYGCLLGKYGYNCEHTCSTHCNDMTCDIWSGNCVCAPGYQGGKCLDECSRGTYGLNCRKRCSNYCKNQTCNPVSGKCNDGCIPGRKGGKCNQECSTGHYGPNCLYTCGACKMSSCSKTNGYCITPGCSSGWKGRRCDITCDQGTFGDDCQYKCHCLNGSSCENVHGLCPNGDCDPGWKSTTCSEICDKGSFGYNCVQTCSKCLYQNCDNVDGTCRPPGQCVAGWIGPRCDEACGKGKYGTDCKKSCSNCLSDTCDNVEGLCTIKDECKPGYFGLKCDQVCKELSFGNNCQDTCHCLNRTSCNNIDGQCVLGSCDRGWRSDSCSERCRPGTFGYDCQEACEGCIDNICEPEDGKCEKSGCKEGYKGEKCEIRAIPHEEKSHSGAIGGGIGAALIILLVAVAVVIFYRKRTQANDKTTKKTKDVKYHSGRINNSYDGPQYDNVEKGELWDKETNPSSSDGLNVKVENIQNEDLYANDTKECDNVYSNAQLNEQISKYRIAVNDLALAVDMKKKSTDFKGEFSMLPVGLQYPHTEGTKEENKQKNRYLTTFPYDHSRVKLVEVSNTDYINANYIKSYSHDKAYIATQGPKKITLNDFWQMIWQENVGKIVMATKLTEGEKKKCEKYWPQTTKSELELKTYTLKMATEKKYSIYIYRCIEIREKKTQTKRLIHQFHFTQWPDHGVPDKTNLVKFHSKVKSTPTKLVGPLVVHCSAGIGRTGTYIALDALYENGQETGFVDVKEFTEMMRQNRMNMIQTVDQYIMVYDVLVEAFRVNNTSMTVEEFLTTNEVREKQSINAEYQKLLELKSKYNDDKYSAGKRKENIHKNAVQSILPHDDFRPFLMSYGKSSNDYINAVIIPFLSEGRDSRFKSFYKPLRHLIMTRNVTRLLETIFRKQTKSFTQGRNYFVTQYPLPETIGDFWSLIDDNDCESVVMMERSDKDVSFIPEKEGEEQYFDNFMVSRKSSSNETDKVLVSLKHKEKTDIRNITVFIYNEWSDGDVTPSSEKSVADFVGPIVNDFMKSQKSMTVVCRDGCTRCGIFLATSLVIEQKEMDEEVDIFQVVRRIQTRRPELLSSIEQYEFCYRCIQEYLSTESLYANM